MQSDSSGCSNVSGVIANIFMELDVKRSAKGLSPVSKPFLYL
jgi:hypothetical protein